MFFYALSLVLILVSSNWFMLWVMLELNLIQVLKLIISFNMTKNLESFVKYFLFQTVNTLLLLAVIMCNTSMVFNWLFLVIILAKLALPPFQFWFLESIKLCSMVSAMILLLFQKLPFLVLMTLLLMKVSVNIVLFSTLFSVVLMFKQSCFILFYIMSSFIHNGWMILSYLNSVMVFTEYVIMYFLASVALMLFINNWNMNLSSLTLCSLLIAVLIMISGIPPFPMFFLKLKILIGLLGQYKLVLLLFLGMSIAALYLYFRFFNQLYILKSMMNTWQLFPGKFLFAVLIMLWAWTFV